jgi:RHS repeat-associated protein
VNLSTGTIEYLVADSLGSVHGVVTASGSLSGSVAYDAWGNPESTGGLSNYTPFGFAGAYTDPSGLIYLIGRYYDPETGQFMSIDPKIQQTQQAYLYTGDDPVNATDPTGMTNVGAPGEASSPDVRCHGGRKVCDDNGLGGLIKALTVIVKAEKDTVHFVATHKEVVTIALTVVGAASALTGVGAVIALGLEASEVAGTFGAASAALSLAGGAANGIECRTGHDGDACVGMALDLVSGITGGLGSVLTKNGASILGGILSAKGFSIGFGGLAWDISTGRW